MLIAQISDLHVTAGTAHPSGIDTAATLARCVGHIARMAPQPDVVLATGDLVESGAPAEYVRLRELLAPMRMPLYVIPGNHDERTAFREAFADCAYIGRGSGPIHYAIDHHALALIALDTTIPGADGGALDALQLGWFDAALRRTAGRPVLVFLHHPPIKTGIRYMDEIALDAASTAQLATMVARAPWIERIVCGHVHRSLQARWNGTVVSVCPSTAYQLELTLGGESSGANSDEPPAYQLHYWSGTELITHTVSVPA